MPDAALPDMSADGLAALTLEDTQLQELNNRFIEGQQEALFGAPDALYRLSGAEAVAAAPRTLAKLDELKATLGDLVPDGEESGELGPQLARQLDFHLASTAAEIRRHVARETQVWQEGVAQHRIALARRQAGLEYRDPRRVGLLAEAGAESAREIARLRGRSGDAIAEGPARSTVFRGAIEQALAQADTGAALKLYDAAQPHLAGNDAAAVEFQIAIARQAEKARAWIDADPPPERDTTQFPFDAPRLLAEIDAWRAAATTRNEAEFSAETEQQATVQHAIDVAAGEQGRAIHLTQTKLDSDVRDWLSKPGPDSAPQTARPPPILWSQLSLERQQTVDAVLRVNSRGAANVEPPLGSPEYEAARAEADSLSMGRGIAPNVEPPPGRPITLTLGQPVALPDGSYIPDRYSPTGYLMAPVADLNPVAVSGREAGVTYRKIMTTGDPVSVGLAQDYLIAALGVHLGHAGLFDYQREGSIFTKYQQHPQWRNVSNVNVGLFCQQAGLPLDLALTIAGVFAGLFSENRDLKAPPFSQSTNC